MNKNNKTKTGLTSDFTLKRCKNAALNGTAKNAEAKAGFTLVEVMIATLILTIALGGLLHAFSACLILNENSRNLSLALNGAQDVIEQIRNNNFANILGLNGTTFFLDQAGVDDPADDWFLRRQDHRGVIQVINFVDPVTGIPNPNLLQVRVVICWRQQGGRIIGEDTNLNGVLDAGEDQSSPPNGRIDSPAELITLISGS
ncbi:MAG: prepilin-type N-terminal cleavage/methylation domain-containing protein [Candidatus Omnitrophica bacterium]|nr:prepilin-type N-terminal cleavage/methylation domain-containing protein [Candidatus Omnitrophota bacterium]